MTISVLSGKKPTWRSTLAFCYRKGIGLMPRIEMVFDRNNRRCGCLSGVCRTRDRRSVPLCVLGMSQALRLCARLPMSPALVGAAGCPSLRGRSPTLSAGFPDLRCAGSAAGSPFGCHDPGKPLRRRRACSYRRYSALAQSDFNSHGRFSVNIVMPPFRIYGCRRRSHGCWRGSHRFGVHRRPWVHRRTG